MKKLNESKNVNNDKQMRNTVGEEMIGNDAVERIALKNEAWITINKNRYSQGEQIFATLHLEGAFTSTEIRALLSEPDGKTVVLEPVRNGQDSYHLYQKAEISGVYTLTCVVEDGVAVNKRCGPLGAAENINRLYICSSCFFVGDCEAAIPKIPAAKLQFVPEMWEDMKYYKLISLFLKKDGKSLPFTPVTLMFRNRSGRFKKPLRTDASGNVFFLPYTAGTYCLVSKMFFDCNGDAGPVEMTAVFSVSLTESEGKKSKIKK